VRDDRADLIEYLRTQLSRRQSHLSSQAWRARPAAVLIPIYWYAGDWNLLYTRRTESVESHRGQVSFPGGMLEPEDKNALDGALREAEEEIGIRAEDVDVIGYLNNVLTVTQFDIKPIVGVISWPYPLQINDEEVAHAFGVPISWLSDPTNIKISERELQASGIQLPVYFFQPYQGEVIWGATARLTINLLKILGLSPL
jgi:8-oxo-dGTP pyrophosphatase MutT (NUDIX family)